MNIIPDFTRRTRRRAIFGVPVHDLDWSHALAFVNELAALSVGQTRIAFLNANNANIMLNDGEYRAVLSEHIVLPDGVGIDLASYILNGAKFQANLNGTDFVPAMLTYIDRKKRIGLIGGTPEVLAGALENFRKHAPWHEFIAISDGYFDKQHSEPVLARIEEAKLDILLVGMGTPLQEKWVHGNIRVQHARLVLCVGALFDFVSEVVPRAPLWIRKLRMEWVYRIACEPSRLWRRYIVGGPIFVFRLLRHRLLAGAPQARSVVDNGHHPQSGDKGVPSEIVFPLKSMNRRP